MTIQPKFVSYRDTKTQEERKKYVEEQISLGNPKYKPLPIWYKENQEKIKLDKLENYMQVISKYINLKGDKLN